MLGVAILSVSLWSHSSPKHQAEQPEKSTSASANQESPAAQKLFDRAAILIKQGRYSEAVSLLRSAIKLAPGQASFHHYLGYALWKLDRWNEAQAEFENAHRLDPKNPYTCYFLARTAASLGHLDQSIEYYEDVLGLGPSIYDTNQRLGQAYLDKGKLGKARVRIEAALEETPWDGSLYYQLGRIDQRERRTAQAQEEFAAASRLKHVDQTAIRQLLQLGEAIQSHHADQAMELRTSLMKQSPPDPEILDSVGVLLGKGGLYAAAVEPLEQSVKLAPDSFESNYNLGLTLLRMGQAQEAQAQLQRALTLQPNSLEVNSLLGVLYVEQNRNQDAIERLRAANQASPGDARVLALLGEQYLLGHYVSDAIPCLTEAIKLQPANEGLRYLLIEAYEEENDYQDALTAAQNAAHDFPSAPRAVYEVGQQLANLGFYQKARPYAEKAIGMDPTLVYAYNLLGDIESRNGQYEAAAATFTKAKALDPKDLLALRGIGQNLIRLGRLPEAVSELSEAIATEPQDSDLYFNLMQAYVRLGERQKAAQAEAEFQKLHVREIAQRGAEAPRNFSPSPAASALR